MLDSWLNAYRHSDTQMSASYSGIAVNTLKYFSEVRTDAHRCLQNLLERLMPHRVNSGFLPLSPPLSNPPSIPISSNLILAKFK